MKKLVVLVGGYYPHYSAIGIVLEKLHAELSEHFELCVLHIARIADEKECEYKGARIIPVSDWLHSLSLNDGRWVRVKRILCRIMFLLCYAWRLQTHTDHLEGAFFKALTRLYGHWKFDCILSLAMPFYMHDAARRFRAKHPDVRWVTYSADTTIGSKTRASCVPISVLRPLFMWNENRKELRDYYCSDFNYMSPEILNNNLKYFEEINFKCRALPYPLFDGDSYLSEREDRRDPDDETVLVYAGILVPGLRTADYFLDVLEKLPATSRVKWHVYLVGEGAGKLRRGMLDMSSRVIIHEPVSVFEMRRIMMHADVLVNLGNDSDLFTPSKVYEYISTGRPIINLSYKGRKRNGDFDKYPMILDLTNFGSSSDDAKAVEDFCTRTKGCRLKGDSLNAIYREHSPAYVAGLVAGSLSGENR